MVNDDFTNPENEKDYKKEQKEIEKELQEKINEEKRKREIGNQREWKKRNIFSTDAESVKKAMESHPRGRMELRLNSIKNFFYSTGNKAYKGIANGFNLIKKHPKTSTAIGIGAIGIGATSFFLSDYSDFMTKIPPKKESRIIIPTQTPILSAFITPTPKATPSADKLPAPIGTASPRATSTPIVTYELNQRNIEIGEEEVSEVPVGKPLRVLGVPYFYQTRTRDININEKKVEGGLEFLAREYDEDLEILRDQKKLDFISKKKIIYVPIERDESESWKIDYDSVLNEYTIFSDRVLTSKNIKEFLVIPAHKNDLLIDKDAKPKIKSFYLMCNKDLKISDVKNSKGESYEPPHLLLPLPAKEIYKPATGKIGKRGIIYIPIEIPD